MKSSVAGRLTTKAADRRTSVSEMPVDPPSPIAIARALSGMTTALGSDINFERGCLEEAHQYLSQDPPNVEKARAEIAEGMSHAFRQFWREDKRPEAWLVAACSHLLR